MLFNLFIENDTSDFGNAVFFVVDDASTRDGIPVIRIFGKVYPDITRLKITSSMAFTGNTSFSLVSLKRGG